MAKQRGGFYFGKPTGTTAVEPPAKREHSGAPTACHTDSAFWSARVIRPSQSCRKMPPYSQERSLVSREPWNKSGGTSPLLCRESPLTQGSRIILSWLERCCCTFPCPRGDGSGRSPGKGSRDWSLVGSGARPQGLKPPAHAVSKLRPGLSFCLVLRRMPGHYPYACFCSIFIVGHVSEI